MRDLPAGVHEIALAGIKYHGKEFFENEVLPIYDAICKIEKDAYNSKPSVAYMAEALCYCTRANLENIAKYGLDIKEVKANTEPGFEYQYFKPNIDLAIRAEAVRRTINGDEFDYRKFVLSEGYQLCTPVLTAE